MTRSGADAATLVACRGPWRADAPGGAAPSQRSCIALILCAMIGGTQEPAAIGGWDKRRPTLLRRLRRRWPL
ncbi:MAG: hypothetical protein ACYCXX_12355 [Acidiferrobacter thiooxydans]|jgi:hypothetical protein